MASAEDILKGLLPVLTPLLNQGIEQLWSQVDAEIAKISSPDVKLVLQGLSPAMKAILEAEIAKLGA